MRAISVIVLVLLSALVLVSGLASVTEDVELKQCRDLCRDQKQFDEKQQHVCIQRCEDYAREKKEWGGRGESAETDPERRVRECKHQCEQHKRYGEQEREVCRSQCEKEFREGGGRGKKYYYDVEEEGEEQEVFGEGGEREENPYVFRDEHFLKKAESQHGRVGVLQRFTERSELLKGIENFRIGFLEADPQTFISPAHFDADGVLFVVQGRGTFTMIRENRGRTTTSSRSEIKRHSFNIETGDVIRVHAGTPVYVVNKHESQKLVIIKFIRPVNTPGAFEAFHGPGGDNPESFFRAFSPELLEAAFKVDRESLQRIFQQKEGTIIKASREQIRALTHGEEGGGIWPFGGESSGPFNLLHRRPTHKNNYGQLFEADPNEFEQLDDLDLMISFANITRGGMSGPFYNSKATKIAYVVDGEGYFEMACPHISSARKEGRRGQSTGSSRGSRQGTTYGQVKSRLKRGTVFVVPAGHPVATVASTNNNLQVVCFEVNARDNFKFQLAGKNNVMSKMESQALELGFGVPAKEVEQIFRNQNEEFFFPGPEMHEQRRRGHSAV
ncbi:unnamed protein product [Linum tenue]|uniref:Cupin type-1 domain-containing protein n=1 Tax=Linum tenue TaxID=586396 RepID=A0AAV0MT18_9ROSI|nr:unnamed protein product [Linum tenue]